MSAAAKFSHGFPMHWWTGVSGNPYPHSVFHVTECPWTPAANFILCAQNKDGTYRPLLVETSENLARWLLEEPALPRALRDGATHIHLHLLAETPERRLAVRNDLRRGLFGERAEKAVDAVADALTGTKK